MEEGGGGGERERKGSRAFDSYQCEINARSKQQRDTTTSKRKRGDRGEGSLVLSRRYHEYHESLRVGQIFDDSLCTFENEPFPDLHSRFTFDERFCFVQRAFYGSHRNERLGNPPRRGEQWWTRREGRAGKGRSLSSGSW